MIPPTPPQQSQDEINLCRCGQRRVRKAWECGAVTAVGLQINTTNAAFVPTSQLWLWLRYLRWTWTPDPIHLFSSKAVRAPLSKAKLIMTSAFGYPTQQQRVFPFPSQNPKCFHIFLNQSNPLWLSTWLLAAHTSKRVSRSHANKEVKHKKSASYQQPAASMLQASHTFIINDYNNNNNNNY